MNDGFPPGCHPRRYRGREDHSLIAAVINAHDAGAGVEVIHTTADVDNHYAHITHCDLDTDMVLVDDAAGGTVAYGRADWWDVDEEKRVYGALVRVYPAHATVAGPLVEWLERRISEIALEHGETLPKVIWSWGHEPTAGEPPSGVTKALRDRSFRPIAYEALMVRPHLDDIPEAVLPDGLEVRSVRPGDLRTIFEADQEAFRDHWGWSEPEEGDYDEFLGFPHRDESLWQIAWDGERVAGQVRTYVNREECDTLGRRRGWTEFISTSREWRRRGVARALICRSLRDLAARGYDEAALGVHVENPNGAFDLYESLGFRLVALEGTYEKPIDG